MGHRSQQRNINVVWAGYLFLFSNTYLCLESFCAYRFVETGPRFLDSLIISNHTSLMMFFQPFAFELMFKLPQCGVAFPLKGFEFLWWFFDHFGLNAWLLSTVGNVSYTTCFMQIYQISDADFECKNYQSMPHKPQAMTCRCTLCGVRWGHWTEVKGHVTVLRVRVHWAPTWQPHVFEVLSILVSLKNTTHFCICLLC